MRWQDGAGRKSGRDDGANERTASRRKFTHCVTIVSIFSFRRMVANHFFTILSQCLLRHRNILDDYWLLEVYALPISPTKQLALSFRPKHVELMATFWKILSV